MLIIVQSEGFLIKQSFLYVERRLKLSSVELRAKVFDSVGSANGKIVICSFDEYIIELRREHNFKLSKADDE